MMRWAVLALCLAMGTSQAQTVGKSFAPSTITSGDTTTLVLTLGNSGPAPITLVAPFTDVLPPGSLVASISGSTCPGVTVFPVDTITVAAGTSIPPGGCSVAASVVVRRQGTNVNTTSTLVTSAGSAPPASATLTVVALPPTMSKFFLTYGSFGGIGVGDSAALLISFYHANWGDIALTAPFVDPIPPPLVASSTNAGTCAGVVVAGGFIVMPAGATIPWTGCTIIVAVTSASAAEVTNTTSALVTDAGTAAPTSATLIVTGTYAIFTIEGGGQSTAVGTPFASVLEAQVTHSGAAVAGLVVTFTLPASGPSGTFAAGGTTASAVTDANGIAKSPQVTANGIAGTYEATVSAPPVPQPRVFGLTNVAASEAPIPVLGPWALLLLVAAIGSVAWRRR